MLNKILKIGTRSSALAIYQTKHIVSMFEIKNKFEKIVIEIITTKGDKILNLPLSKIGGKGLFTRELENAIKRCEIDLAVHSLKDTPIKNDDELFTFYTKREDPRDCFISTYYKNINELPNNAKVGTTSLRRAMQLLHMRPDLNILNLRGNVETRIHKLKHDHLDAIILAVCGLKRLDILRDNSLHFHYFDIDEMIPAMGQGALAVELRYPKNERDQIIFDIVKNAICIDKNELKCLKVEREVINRLQAGCQSPIGIYVNTLNDNSNNLEIRFVLGDLIGKRKITKHEILDSKNLEMSLNNFIENILKTDALNILNEVKNNL